jgi:hypothetical protein
LHELPSGNGWLLICSENLLAVFCGPDTVKIEGVMLSKLPITEEIVGLDRVAEISVTLAEGEFGKVDAGSQVIAEDHTVTGYCAV